MSKEINVRSLEFLEVNGELVQPGYYKIYKCSKYCIVVSENHSKYKYGCIDFDGNVIVPIIYSSITELTDEIVIATINNKESLISVKTGKKLTDSKWIEFFKRTLSEGHITAMNQNNCKLAILNFSTFKPITKARFNDTGCFSNGICCVSVNYKWGAIDYSGNFVVKPKYLSCFEFYLNFAIVKKIGNNIRRETATCKQIVENTKYGVIFKNGTEVLHGYDNIERSGPTTFTTEKGSAIHVFQFIVKPEFIIVIKDGKYEDGFFTAGLFSKRRSSPKSKYYENAKYIDGGKWYAIDFNGKKLNIDEETLKNESKLI